MSGRLCWSTREPKVYLAIGKGCFGFSWSDSSVSHLWSYEGFVEDVRVVVEGISGLLAVSSGRSIHILDPYSPAKPRVSWMDAHKDTIYAMHFDAKTGILFSSGKDNCLKAWEVLNEELSLIASTPDSHQNWVMSIQFDPIRRLLITAGMDGLVRAWRLDSSGNFFALATSEDAHPEGILTLCSNMESNISVSSGKDGCLQLWRYQSSSLRMVACEAESTHEGWVKCLQFDPPSGLVVSSGDDGAIRVFKYQEERFLPMAEGLHAHPSGILGLIFCPKTMRVLSAGEDGSMRCWTVDCDAKTITLQAKVDDAHDGGAVSHIQYDVRRKLVVTAGSDQCLRAWLLDQTFTAMAYCQGEGVLALQLDAEDDICYCAHADSSISVWKVDVGLGELRHIATESNAHSGRILAFNFAQVSKLLLTAGVDKAIRAWQLHGKELRMVCQSTQFLNSGVLALAYDAKTGIVLSAGMRGGIKAWRHSGDRLVPINLDHVDHSEGLLILHFDASSMVILSGGLDGALKAWQLTLASVKRIREPMQAHKGWSRAMHYDVKNGYVASCGDDGHVKAWELKGETLTPLGSALAAHPDGARGVLINGGFGLVLSCGDDGVIKAFKLSAWETNLVSSCEHPGPVFNLQYFNPQLVSCSMDGTLKVWKVDGNGALSLQAESSAEKLPTLAMKYDPTSRTIFTAGLDGTIRVWRLEQDGIMLLSSIEAHEGMIRSMQYDRQGRTLVTAGEDGRLCAWSFKAEKLSKKASVEAISSGIHVIAWVRSSCTVIAASADASLSVWEMSKKTFREACSVKTAHVNVINALHYDDDLSTVFTGCHSVRVWKLAASKLTELHHLQHPFGLSHSVTALRYSHALSLLVGCSTTGAICSWFYSGGSEPIALWQVENAHSRGTMSVVFDSQRSLFVTGGNDKTLKTWHLQGNLELMGVATEAGKSKVFTACPKQFAR